MAGSFEILEHTADIGVAARGASLKEAFAQAALGLFSLITDLDGVRESQEKEIEVQAQDEEGLLVAWLNELIYIFDVENLVFRRFQVLELDPTRLRARAYGEKVDPSRHVIQIGVKAATYHMLRIEKGQDCRVQVLFDI